MATTDEKIRATELARQALELIKSGNAEYGTRLLREAAATAPENENVRAAFEKINLDDSLHLLLRICKEFVDGTRVTAGKEAISYLTSNATQVSTDLADQCFELILKARPDQDRELYDELVAVFLEKCLGARIYLARKLLESVHATFERIFHIGDGASNGLITAVLDPTAWSEQSARRDVENDVFRLFLAKLLENGHDFDGRALKGIARHLSVDGNRLHTLIDEGSFDAILSSLDYQLAPNVKTQAALATAKYLEASKDTGERYFKDFIMTRVRHSTNQDLVLAFSAAAAIFPLSPTLLAGLFLTEGFLPSLVPMLDKKSRSKRVEIAALNMLNAACIESACREAISKTCTEWMYHVIEGEDDTRRGHAAVILAKLKFDDSTVDDTLSNKKPQETRVVSTLMDLFLHGDESEKIDAIEGIAFASTQSRVKERVVGDSVFLARLLRAPKENAIHNVAFGSLTVVDNLAHYLPDLSEEQVRMKELKAYANASKSPAKMDLLDDEQHVTHRCKRLIEAGAVPYLVGLKTYTPSGLLSPGTSSIMARILRSLSKAPQYRGEMVQQGAIPLLLQICKDPKLEVSATQAAAHAIARMLISVNPRLVSNHVRSTLSPVLSLIDPPESEDDGPHDLLPVFEGLLALTNLVSDPSLTIGPDVVRIAFTRIEDLLLHNNTLIRRAATELICNLMTCAEGLEKFADGSKASGRRLHVLLALADTEDVGTRRATGGALAMVTEFEDAVKGILGIERGIIILLNLCQDDDPQCIIRGVVCIRNTVCTEGSTGLQARDKVRGLDGVEIFKGIVKASKDRSVIESGIEVLKVLVTSPT